MNAVKKDDTTSGVEHWTYLIFDLRLIFLHLLDRGKNFEWGYVDCIIEYIGIHFEEGGTAEASSFYNPFFFDNCQIALVGFRTRFLGFGIFGNGKIVILFKIIVDNCDNIPQFVGL